MPKSNLVDYGHCGNFVWTSYFRFCNMECCGHAEIVYTLQTIKKKVNDRIVSAYRATRYIACQSNLYM